MNCREVRSFIRRRIDDWRREGDDAPQRELLVDAFLHLRWSLERGNGQAHHRDKHR